MIFEALACHSRGGPYPEKRTPEYTQPMSVSIRISSFTDERKLCTTKSGQYAWVPGCATEGDMIFFVRGAKVPFMLWPVHDLLVGSTHMKQYQLVGEAWVENIMEGNTSRESTGNDATRDEANTMTNGKRITIVGPMLSTIWPRDTVT
ncbi:uncharacterized protein CC84DRAFT_1178845 [Paraphaeosphaeria sporulosa]|uniref:Uncharacterized protein n=1 Tax=Paraphaeosphaeria sporulosa TaxID=1460663 RepID=A0A177C940_9PLEO|nr:uncharacterized protein CC84DRAFT_1178845 [Paraphaeosphaeria sporulosa]OAG03372.1 hypothetical protein CC84DRAFT_1178845 [Paraphaeosphaeria sporulosa]